MLIFFDVIMGLRRVVGEDGAEFKDIETARAEATTIASEVVIEELRRGGRVGADWRIDVKDAAGIVLSRVLFYEVIFEPIANSYTATSLRRHLLGDPISKPSYHCSMAIIDEARVIAANVRNVFLGIKGVDETA